MQDLTKLKKIIVILAILICIIFIVILSLSLSNSKNEEQNSETEQLADETIDYENVVKEKVVGNREFYNVTNCIQTYIDTINTNATKYYGTAEDGSYARVITDEAISNMVYDMLSEKYIKENNIEKDNALNYVQKIEDRMLFVPKEMYELKGEIANKYLVSGFLVNSEFEKQKDIYIFVNIHEKNSTFSIEEINEKYDSIEDIEIENENIEITANSNNKFTSPKITNEYIARQCFNTFKQTVLGDSKVAYEYLNEEYRNKRFGTYEKFEKYIEENREWISTLGLEKYLVNLKDEYSEYVCLDYMGNYYTFREKGPLNYEVFMDNYTIDSEDFINKYNSSDEKTKAGLNVEKIFEALNKRDYAYVYEHLADSFKSNYYQDQNSFEEYMKENLYDYRYKQYQEYKTEGNIQIFKLTVSDKKDEGQGNEKNMTIIMQLKEGTDFVMSFSIE